jgi:purine-binding chemotaxis protein CheW
MSNLEKMKENMNEDSQNGKFLTYNLGNENYGISIKYVTEIIGIQNITSLPDLPNYVKGVINLRGKVIPVVDVRLRFNFEERDYDERTCTIVININDINVGVIVDAVKEVINISESQIDPPPKVQKGSESRFVKGLGKVNNSVIIILDVDKFLFEEELEKIIESVHQS